MSAGHRMNSPATPSLASAPPCLTPIAADELTATMARRLGEQKAARWFREEIQVHEADLRAYLRSRFSGLPDTEDIIQDCYARLFRMREQASVPITRAYLFVVARNAAIDLIRRKQTVPLEPLDQLVSSSVVEEGAHAADQLCHAEELQLLEEAIRDLPPRCRDIIILRRLHGLSHREIGRRFQISEATVHAQLCIGLKRCRQYLCAHGVTKACLHVENPS